MKFCVSRCHELKPPITSSSHSGYLTPKAVMRSIAPVAMHSINWLYNPIDR